MADASAKDRATVQAVINSYYKAGGQSGWNREVNKKVARVFGTMLIETKKCSEALSWVPQPTTGPATIKWIAKQLGKSFIKRMRDKTSTTCIKGVIYRWGRRLNRASILG